MKSYIFSADLVRVGAILAVIGVHLVIPITARPDFFEGTIWWLTFLLNCGFRVSVPLFIMLSGYLTLGKPVTIQQNLKKVFLRLVVPLLSYYLIFTVAYALMAYLRAEPYDYWGIFHNLSKNTHSSLYFLVILIFLHLLNPLWNLISATENKSLLKYVCYFFLILGAVSSIFYYISLREGEVFSTYTYWVMWVGYYLYGILVRQSKSKLKSIEIKKYLSWVFIGYLLTFCLGFLILWLYHRGLSDLFYLGGQTYADGYLSFSVMLMAMGVFQLVMRTKKIQQLESYFYLRKIVQFLAGLAFALYLNHLLVMDVLSKFFGVTPDSPTMPGLWGYLLIETLSTFLITIPLAYVLKNTPVLRKIVGET